MYYQKKNPHGGCGGRSVRFDFSASVNPLGTPESVRQAVRGALRDLWNYPDPYCRDLVRAVADAERTDPENILCGNGASELIRDLLRALKPEQLLMPAPTFCGYTENCAAPARQYPLREDLDFRVDGGFLDFLKREMRDTGGKSVVILCTPNNPTGGVICRERMVEILALCREMAVPVLVDECFLDFTDFWAESLTPLLRDFPNLFVLKAFTKNYGMAGLRLGVLFSADHAALKRTAEEAPPWDVSLPAQLGGVAALREKNFLARTRELVRVERKYLTEELKQCGLTDRVIPSDANFIFFHGAPDLAERLLARGIAIRSFPAESGLSAGWYRIAVRTHAENAALVGALRALEREIG